jgi:hypothetical protein
VCSYFSRIADGRKYTGQWDSGLQSGIGHYVNQQGTERKGEWFHGKRLRWFDEENVSGK